MWIPRTQHLSVSLLVTLALASACGGGENGEEGAHRSQGVVTNVDVQKQEITLDHEEIPGLMKAMTMTFEVSDPELLEDVDPGDEVEFEVIYENGEYRVTAVEPMTSP